MDFDAPWCPACDKLIAPKHNIPPPPPPPSPHRRPKQHVTRKHGLVAGTGRVRPNGTLKTSPPLPPVVTKTKSPVPHSQQTPLYCSDKCHMADINAHRSAAPIDPAQESPDTSIQTPAVPKHSGSIAKLAKILNFPPLPPPPPTYDEPEADIDGFATEYNSGIMMAGRLLDSFRTPARKPQNGKYSPPQERKEIPGWNDGSNAWRSALYSTASHKPSEVERYKDQPSAYTTCNPSYSKSPRPKSTPSPLLPPPPPAPSSDEMLARYNAPFSRRSESRMSLYGPPPTSPVSTSPTRERTLLPKGAEGKILVRDVKLKPHSGSSASLSSGWSGPTSASSRRSARSPLSLTSDSSEDPFPGKRPVFETRSWSYDNVDTYPTMEIPVKKVKKIEVQIIDGVPTEVEVEVVEKPKCLFLFAPTTRLSSR